MFLRDPGMLLMLLKMRILFTHSELYTGPTVDGKKQLSSINQIFTVQEI